MRARAIQIVLLLLFVLVVSSYIVESATLNLYLCRPPFGSGACNVKSAYTQIPGSGVQTVTLSSIPSNSLPTTCDQEGAYWLNVVGDMSSTSIASYTIDWDLNQRDCECLNYVPERSSDWKSSSPNGKRCCGDDLEGDSGIKSSEQPSKYACLGDANGWSWKNREETKSIGSVYLVKHPAGRDFTILSNKDYWIACAASNNSIANSNFAPAEPEETRTQGGVVQKAEEAGGTLHDYICTTNNITDTFVECAGSGGCVNKGTVKKCVTKGAMIEGRYCSVRNEWIGDLNTDITGETCEAAGFEWTGSHCCGPTREALGDNYNDKRWMFFTRDWYSGFRQEYVSGCFGNKRVINNTRVSDTNIIKDTKWAGGDAEGTGRKLEGVRNSTQDISFRLYPGETYIFSALITGSGIENPKPSYAALFSKGVEVPGTRLYADANKVEFTVNAEQAKNLNVVLVSEKTGYITTYFDDITLVMKSNRIMSVNGSFYGCRLGDTAARYKDTLTGKYDLIAEDFSQYCTIIGTHYCGEEGWMRDSTKDITGKLIASKNRNWSSTLPNGTVGCCPQDNCWIGSKCIPPEADPNEAKNQIKVDGKTFICVEGGWQESNERRDFWGRKGFCPQQTQCLFDLYGTSVQEIGKKQKVNLSAIFKELEILLKAGRLNELGMLKSLTNFGTDSAKSDNPRCVPENTIVGDFVCKEKLWTTRTKELAMSMVRKAGGNDFTLYCDNWKRVLPYADKIDKETKQKYIVGSPGGLMFEILDEDNSVCRSGMDENYPCTNNYCILSYTEDEETKTFIGTTLNTKINDKDHSFAWGILKKDPGICNSISASGFKSCSGEEGISYNKELNAVIYSSATVGDISAKNQGEETIFSSLVQSMRNILDNLKRGKFDLEYPWQAEQDFTDQMNRLNKIYITRKGDKRIFAGAEVVGEADGRPTLTVQYPEEMTSQGAEICTSIDKLSQGKFSKSIDCKQEGSSIKITSTDSATINKYWQDLTSKLRLQ